jgi:dTDP-glucose 4,6-dehydratase
MTRVLLTGIGGFVGSHCVRYFLNNTDWHIVGLDSFRHKGTYSRLNYENIVDNSRVTLLKHDLTVPIDTALENQIMDRSIVNGKVVESGIDYVISMASDSAVERSVTDPAACWRNNCELVLNMLELSRRIKPKVFLQISTDEVYGDCPAGYSHPEWDIILPSNPYSASKAAQEALCISYWRSYNMPIVLSNTMNMIGITQDKEKFLPKLIWKIATEQEMEIYADTLEDGTKFIGTRFYLHCDNHADALMWILEKPVTQYSHETRFPDRYNICGNKEFNNLEFAQLVAKLMNKPLKYRLVESKSARPGYDRRYALDGSKLNNLGWKPPLEFEESLKRIINWQLENPHWVI